MNPIEKYGKDSVNDRSLFVLELESSEAIKKFSLPAAHFACLVAWDSESVADEKIYNLLDCIIASGAAYICCWGKGCERVHDTADEIDHVSGPSSRSEGIIMTTWHSKEHLSEAIWFLLNTTWPDKFAEETLGATVAISIGSNDYAEEIRSALKDPRAFSKKVLENEEGAL